MYVAFAGSEPESFKDLFPFWINKKDINEVSRNDNPFHPQQKVKADALLATYNRYLYLYTYLRRIIKHREYILRHYLLELATLTRS